MVSGIDSDAWRVDRANWKLFLGSAVATLTLNGDGLPSVSFRCAITLSTTAGHTDVTGSVTVGAEVITFTAATKKTTTTLLTALPTITTSGLDCTILIEAINSGGANILKETATAIECRYIGAEKAYRNGQGEWVMSQATVDTTDSACDVGDIFSFGGYDYVIDQVIPRLGRSVEKFRTLQLIGKTAAPLSRT